MNTRQWLGFMSALALVLAGGSVSASAASKGSVDLDVNSATSLSGTQLPEGRYNVSWDSTDDSTAKVTFKARGKVVAEATARIEQRGEAAPYDAVVSRTNGSGKTVAEVRLRGKKGVLVIS